MTVETGTKGYLFHWDITIEDVHLALGVTLKEAERILPKINAKKVWHCAKYGADLEEQTQYANEEINRQFRNGFKFNLPRLLLVKDNSEMSIFEIEFTHNCIGIADTSNEKYFFYKGQREFVMKIEPQRYGINLTLKGDKIVLVPENSFVRMRR